MVKNSLQNGIDTGLFRAEIDVEFVSRLYLNGMRGIRDIEIFPIEQFKIEAPVRKLFRLSPKSHSNAQGTEITNPLQINYLISL